MNEAWAKLVSCDQDVTTIMRWWLVKKAPKRYLRMAFAVGGVREVIQETCLKIVARTKPPDIDCHWSTAAINQTRWTLLHMLRKHARQADLHSSFLHDIAHELTADDIQVELAMQKELAEAMAQCLKTLPSWREKTIVELRMDGMTLEEVAHITKVTRERIRQIEMKAIAKLSQPNVSRDLVMFLE